jgi:hypothetical protein
MHAAKDTGSSQELSVQQWVSDIATPEVRTCLTETGRYYDSKTGRCTSRDFCIYRLPGDRCKMFGDRKEGDTAVLIKRQREALRGHSVEDCIEGGKIFYLGGVCTSDKACIFQTAMMFGVKQNHERISPEKQYPKCTKHYTPRMCVSGKRLMREKGACLLTGSQECGYQDCNKQMPIRDKNYARCSL